MFEFNLKTEGVKLKQLESSEITTNGAGIAKCVFCFDSAWDGLVKTAMFYTKNGAIAIKLDNDTCLVPADAMVDNIIVIGVIGVNDIGIRLPSTMVRLYLLDGAYVGETFEPTPTLWEQYIAQMNELYTSTKGYSEDAEECVSGFDDKVNQAKTDISNLSDTEKTALSKIKDDAITAKNDAVTAKKNVDDTKTAIDGIKASIDTKAKDVADNTSAVQANANKVASDKQAAETSASNASQYAGSANQSAVNAAASAESAAGAVENHNTSYEAHTDIREDITQLNKDIVDFAIKPSVSGTSIHVEDSAEMPLKSLSVHGKNIVKSYAVSKELNGLTFMVNDDKTITVNGTATAKTRFDISHQKQTLKAGSYIMNGGVGTNAYITVLKSTGDSININSSIGTDVPFTLNEDLINFSMRCYIISGTVCDNLVFKPMIRISTDTDGTYEQYTDSVDLTVNDGNGNTQTATINTETQTGGENLHSYYGTTNIIPSVSANIDCTYVADTKLYIDKKIVETQALTLDN